MSSYILVVLILSLGENLAWASSAEFESLHSKLDQLTDRLTYLEAKDAANQRELQVMKDRMDSLEGSFMEREKVLQDEITDLKQRLQKDDVPRQEHGAKEQDSVDGARKQSRFDQRFVNDPVMTALRTRRYENEAQVAFFATVTQHDVEHMGANQNIVFDNAVTNIGNGYHKLHGIFSAPVDGIYVFSTTICGRHTGSGSFYAYLNINGVVRAKFIIHAYEQSSHSAIVQLTAGDDVSVDNANVDEALIGDMYTSFSGFLLYQQYPGGSSAIVG